MRKCFYKVTNNPRSTFSVSDSSHDGFQLIVCKTDRIGDTK